METIAGVDIGGTKCAVVLGRTEGDSVEIVARDSFPTPSAPDTALAKLEQSLRKIAAGREETICAIGVSCGNPLDSRRGVILNPPNLPGWEQVEVVSFFQDRFGVPAALQNDANAGALAEWRWGSGRGCRNLVFLTFGTGMGAGLILDGRLYAGTNDNAGEIGHVRLRDDGPLGYGKAGSFEGFCSGGGIARLAAAMTKEAVEAGHPPSYYSPGMDMNSISPKTLAQAAQSGDALAIRIWQTVGRELGRGLAIIIDILNPERILIGSIYGRQRGLLDPYLMAALKEEALPQSLEACSIMPAGLGEQIGDYASLAVAMHAHRLPTASPPCLRQCSPPSP